MSEVVKENELFNQLADIRLKKSQEYNKKIAAEQKILDKKHEEKIKQELKNKLEEEQIMQHNKYLSNIEETQLLESDDKHEKIFEDLQDMNQKNIEESKRQLANLKSNKTFLSYNHGEIMNYGKQNNDLSFLDESFIIIFSLFDHDNHEGFNTQKFVKSIIDNFYDCVNKTELNNLYTFYVSIKEISTSFDNIDIELIISSLDFINMDYHFIDVLNKSNKLEHIRIIFKEFVKIIDKVKSFL